MEPWFFSCWMVLVLFRRTSADPDPPPRYVIHPTRASFDQALEQCSPGGLTTLTTEQELADILGAVSRTVQPLDRSEFTFWVGLRKVKNECVVPTLPLRGFKWTEDGSEESQVSRWSEEPKHTCTTVRCAALKGEVDGSTVTRWGLIPVTCKNSYQFICKVRDALTGGTLQPPPPITSEPPPAAPEPQKPATPEPQKPATPEPQKPATPEPQKPATPEPQKPATPEPQKSATPEPQKPATTEPQKPATPEPQKPVTPEPQKPATPEPQKPATPEPHKPETATQKPEPATPELELPTMHRDANRELTPTTGPELRGPDPDRGSEPAVGCQHPVVNGSRFLSLDPDNSSRIQVDCWSTVRLELRCSGRPAVWRLLDDTPADLSAICRPCDDGFHKNTNGTCVDVDECRSGSAPCRHTCLNTEGSYRCVCSDEDGNHHDDDSPACKDTPIVGDSGWMIAVAALVVLVVLVAVVVRCCVVRRSKRRAMKKAEKMAMRSNDDKDAFDTEKAAS